MDSAKDHRPLWLSALRLVHGGGAAPRGLVGASSRSRSREELRSRALAAAESAARRDVTQRSRGCLGSRRGPHGGGSALAAEWGFGAICHTSLMSTRLLLPPVSGVARAQLVVIIVSECTTGSGLSSMVDIDKALDQLQLLADDIPNSPAASSGPVPLRLNPDSTPMRPGA